MKKAAFALPRFTFLLGGLWLAACASLPQDPEGRQALDRMADEALARLQEEQPETVPLIAEAKALLVADMKQTKIPLLGWGGGQGVIRIAGDPQPVYVSVSRADMGMGYGARSYKAVLLVEDEALVDRARKSFWHVEFGSDVSAGSSGVGDGSGTSRNGYRMYVLSEGGGSATFTGRLFRISIEQPSLEAPDQPVVLP